MKRVLMLILVLFVASAAWGDSIPYTLDFVGHFADGRTLHGDGLFLQSAGGQIIYGSGNNRFHGSVSPTMLWSGSTFGGAFAGIQQAFGYSATCGTYHPRPSNHCSFIYYVTGTYRGTWNGNWKSLAKVQLDITSSRLITSGVIPEPGTWILGLTGLAGIWLRRWAVS
jgi:hypothetical protein